MTTTRREVLSAGFAAAGYARGKVGTIARDGGIEELQDTDTPGLGEGYLESA